MPILEWGWTDLQTPELLMTLQTWEGYWAAVGICWWSHALPNVARNKCPVPFTITDKVSWIRPVFSWLHQVLVEAGKLGFVTEHVVPWPRMEPGPLQWEHRVSASGPPVKAPDSVLSKHSWVKNTFCIWLLLILTVHLSLFFCFS